MLDPIHLLRLLQVVTNAIVGALILGPFTPAAASADGEASSARSSGEWFVAQYRDPERQYHHERRVYPEALYAPVQGQWQEIPPPPSPPPREEYTPAGKVGAAIGTALPDVAIIGGAMALAGPTAGAVAAAALVVVHGSARYQEQIRHVDSSEASRQAFISAAPVAVAYAALIATIVFAGRAYRRVGGLSGLRSRADRCITKVVGLWGSGSAARFALYGVAALAIAYALLFVAWSAKVMLAQLLG